MWTYAISNQTAKAYQTAMTRLIQFSTMCGVITRPGTLPPLSETILIRFVTFCHQYLDLKYNTIKLYLAGIRFHYLREGNTNPFANSERLEYILKGVKRSQAITGTNTEKRFPITYNILCSITSALQNKVFSFNVDLLLLCACQMAFFGFLRCGEFTVRNTVDTSSVIRLCDIVWSQDNSHYTVILRRSKTDPFGNGTPIHIFNIPALNTLGYMKQLLLLRRRQVQ